MDQPSLDPKRPVPQHHQEFQDPQFHDDDAVEPPADDEGRSSRSLSKRKPARRIPPSRRRFEDF